MNFERERALKIVNSRSNEIIKKFILNKFPFSKVTNSQVATFEGILEQRKFNLESSKIMEFILEKLEKQKNEEFFQSILKNYIGKKDEILELLEIKDANQDIKNNIFRDIFYLIKKTYRAEKAREILMGRGEMENGL